jgi:hypothetical protein
MPLARLRRILNSRLVVNIESNADLLDEVNRKIAARIRKLQERNKPAPVFKPATSVAQFDGMQWSVRPMRLLHKLGRMTTPRGLGNMSRLSAGWATRRYFWAIAESVNTNNNFRLSNDALGLDFHQKVLLSDEFGIAMAGLFMEEQVGAPETMDVSLALRDEVLAEEIELSGETQPDYLMWNEQATPTYFLVECKGGQSGRSASIDQLRRGLEQLPSIDFANPEKYGGAFAVATCLSESSTSTFVIDPPSDEDNEKRAFEGETVSERTGERRWKIVNEPALEKRNRVSKAAQVLQWAGQNHHALRVAGQLEQIERGTALPDLPIEIRDLGGVEFHGQRLPLFPELSPTLHVFLGVDAQTLIAAEQEGEVPFDVSHHVAERSRAASEHTEVNESISLDGTCMRIEGLPM